MEDLDVNSKVILELSSWQLRDIKNAGVKFKIAAITNLLNDHQNYYNSMEDYLNEKLIMLSELFGDKDFLVILRSNRDMYETVTPVVQLPLEES